MNEKLIDTLSAETDIMAAQAQKAKKAADAIARDYLRNQCGMPLKLIKDLRSLDISDAEQMQIVRQAQVDGICDEGKWIPALRSIVAQVGLRLSDYIEIPVEYDMERLFSRSSEVVNFNALKSSTQYVDGILTEGVFMLNAFSKVGKSRFLLQMLLAICNGDKFLERRTTKSGALYLALEDDFDRDFAQRLKQFLDGDEQPPNLHTLTKTDFYDEAEGTYITPRLGSTGGLSALISSFVEKFPDIKVVGIDVFSCIRSKRKSKDFTEDEQRDINELQALAQKYDLSIVVAHHVSKAGLRDLSSSQSSIGAGAGSYSVSGTVTGEFSICLDPKDKTKAVFKAESRRTPSCGICLTADFPRWLYSGELEDKLREEAEREREEQVNAIFNAVDYLLDTNGGEWLGTNKQFEAAVMMTDIVLPGKIKDDTFKTFNADLRSKGIFYEMRSNGNAPKKHKFVRCVQEKPEQATSEN